MLYSNSILFCNIPTRRRGPRCLVSSICFDVLLSRVVEILIAVEMRTGQAAAEERMNWCFELPLMSHSRVLRRHFNLLMLLFGQVIEGGMCVSTESPAVLEHHSVELRTPSHTKHICPVMSCPMAPIDTIEGLLVYMSLSSRSGRSCWTDVAGLI